MSAGASSRSAASRGIADDTVAELSPLLGADSGTTRPRAVVIGAPDLADAGYDVIASIEDTSLIEAYHPRGNRPPSGIPRALRQFGTEIDLVAVELPSLACPVREISEGMYEALPRTSPAPRASAGITVPYGSPGHIAAWKRATRRFARDLERWCPHAMVLATGALDGEDAAAYREPFARHLGGRLFVLDELASDPLSRDSDHSAGVHLALSTVRPLPSPLAEAPGAAWELRYAEEHELGGVELIDVRIADVVQIDDEIRVRVLSDGSPARFVEASLSTQLVTREFVDPRHSLGSALLSHSSGAVYGAFRSPNDGSLWRLDVGATMPVLVAERVAGESMVRSIAEGPDGSILVTTYPNGRLIRLMDDHRIVDLGPVADDARYAWGLAVLERSAWVGTGPRPRLVRLDIESGEREEITLPTDAPTDGAFVVNVRQWHGRLIVQVAVDPSQGAATYLYDPATREWSTAGPLSIGLSRCLAANEDTGKFACIMGDAVELFDGVSFAHIGSVPGLSDDTVKATVTIAPTTSGFVGVVQDGSVWTWDGESASGARLPLQPSRATLHSLWGDDRGTVVVGTFLGTGAMGIAGRSHAKINTVEGPGQVDSIAEAGALLLGTYPGVGLHSAVVDVEGQRWLVAPTRLAHLGRDESGLDRPAALVATRNVAYIGTVATYGATDGAVVAVPLNSTNPTPSVAKPVPGQSVTALHVAGDILVGGTSIHGGLGSSPKHTMAEVFALQMPDLKVLWRRRVPLATVVSGLAPADDGCVAVLTDHGELLVVRCTDGALLKGAMTGLRHGNAWGREAGLHREPSTGAYIVLSGGVLAVLSADLRRIAVLRANVKLAHLAASGWLYTASARSVFRARLIAGSSQMRV